MSNNRYVMAKVSIGLDQDGIHVLEVSSFSLKLIEIAKKAIEEKLIKELGGEEVNIANIQDNN